jgi:hypothetical protein
MNSFLLNRHQFIMKTIITFLEYSHSTALTDMVNFTHYYNNLWLIRRHKLEVEINFILVTNYDAKPTDATITH